MKIVHEFNNQKKEGEGEGLFLLTNKSGDFFSTIPSNNFSKYNGLINYESDYYKDYFKSVESINIRAGNPLKITNYFDRVEVEYEEGVKEIYRICEGGLIYSVQNYKGPIRIFLDMKKLYDDSTTGRIYEHKYQKEKLRLITNYKKYSDEKENNEREGNKPFYECSLAIIGVKDVVINDPKNSVNWFEKNYPYEQRRNDSSNYWINNAYTINSQGSVHLVFSFAKTELLAIKKSDEVAKNINLILKEKKQEVVNLVRNTNSFEEGTAFFALKQLLVKRKNDKRKKILAGLPWFHQNWTRDELVSLGVLIKKGYYQESKNAIMEVFDNYYKQRFKAMNSGEGLNSKDSLGWLAKRTNDLIEVLKKQNKLKNYFSPHELGYLREKTRYILKVELEASREGLIFNDVKETWMDTISRKGFSIEVQFGFLALFKLELYLSKLTAEKTIYSIEFKNFKALVRKKFYDKEKKYLADNITEEMIVDYSARPNIFLANYLYKELLSNNEWDKVFEKVIEKLSCGSGLFSSIDKNHSLYKGIHTGSNNNSYHNGDSWYYINNLIAVVLRETNKKKYGELIKQVKEKSINNLFFEGCIAACNEISSSSKSEPLGCFNQAWSDAMLIELLLSK